FLETALVDLQLRPHPPAVVDGHPDFCRNRIQLAAGEIGTTQREPVPILLNDTPDPWRTNAQGHTVITLAAQQKQSPRNCNRPRSSPGSCPFSASCHEKSVVAGSTRLSS